MPRRYRYSHRHNWDTTADIGKIMPSFYKFVTPLDTWGGQQVSIGRLSPMNKPFYGDLYLDTFFFFVPLKDIWNRDQGFADEFRDIIGNKDTSYTWPLTTSSKAKSDANFDLHGSFGVGVRQSTEAAYVITATHSMAYQHVYNKYFMDPRFETEIDLTSGDNNVKTASFKGQGYLQLLQNDIEQGSPVTVDTSGSTLAVQTIKDAMREDSYKRLKERYGEEYEDILKLHGVNPGSLGKEGAQLVAKGSSTVGVSEVLATAEGSTTKTGEYSGHGIVIHRTSVPKRLYLEYGVLLGVSVFRPRLGLKNRIPYEFTITDGDDLYHKFYVGNQMRNVPAQEIFSGLLAANRGDPFAYIDKYEYLRKSTDVVAGQYLVEDTYDEQIFAREHGAFGASAPDSHADMMSVNKNEWDYLFQDSSQPHVFLHHMNRVGVNSIVPPHG